MSAQDMASHLRAQESAAKRCATEAPREVQELEARLQRLRERLKHRDPDLTADELQAAIDRAYGKLAELRHQASSSGPSANVLTLQPKAAEKARAEIEAALTDDSRVSLKARVFNKEAFGGKVRLVPEPEGGLVAHWNLAPGALLRAVGTSGSGGRI